MTETEPKRGRGRPFIDPADRRVPIRLRLPPSMIKDLDEASLDHSITVTAIVEEAVAGWLQRNGGTPAD